MFHDDKMYENGVHNKNKINNTYNYLTLQIFQFIS